MDSAQRATQPGQHCRHVTGLAGGEDVKVRSSQEHSALVRFEPGTIGAVDIADRSVATDIGDRATDSGEPGEVRVGEQGGGVNTQPDELPGAADHVIEKTGVSG